MPNWIRVCSTDDCPPGEARELVAGDRIVALFNVDGQYRALDGVCPHQGGPLGEGSIENGLLRCPWHGFEYDLTSGLPLAGEPDHRRMRLRHFKARFQGDDVIVEI